MEDKLVGRHVFCFDDDVNGGESLILKTEYFDNGDGVATGLYCTQELSLMSYSNSAVLNLSDSQLTPARLRRLADQLETLEKTIKGIT